MPVPVTISADGDSWRAELADDGGKRIVVFFCLTTDQRPYRVACMDSGWYPDAESLENVPEEQVKALFRSSGSMGVRLDFPAYGR